MSSNNFDIRTLILHNFMLGSNFRVTLITFHSLTLLFSCRCVWKFTSFRIFLMTEIKIVHLLSRYFHKQVWLAERLKYFWSFFVLAVTVLSLVFFFLLLSSGRHINVCMYIGSVCLGLVLIDGFSCFFSAFIIHTQFFLCTLERCFYHFFFFCHLFLLLLTNSCLISICKYKRRNIIFFLIIECLMREREREASGWTLKQYWHIKKILFLHG